jgi:hypothetical protein
MTGMLFTLCKPSYLTQGTVGSNMNKLTCIA